MTLATGTRLGAYEILSPLGSGGMGEVYRARDTRLGRNVAIKVLPAAFTSDAERLARFEREARTLASLSHSHIGAIYGLEQSEAVRYLVLELVPGESLAARLARGALPERDALEVARQIADGLEAAHEKGVVHRDLKPGNVQVGPDGAVKILDFGLAKALADEAASATADDSPTITAIVTRAGVLLGTAAYMSPEQARGKPVDRRADIWAFGCVLYEMLAGRMAFRGDTTTDTLAGVLEREPDWAALPATTPPGVRRLLGRCLQKDPRRRLRDIADARIDVDEALSGPSSRPLDAATASAFSPPPSRSVLRHPLPVGLALLALAFAAAFLWALRRAPASGSTPAPVTRFTITLPPNQQISSLAISRDARELVYGVAEDRGQPGPVGDVVMLYRRRLDEVDARPVPGTEFGYSPFFSPDGEWLGFTNGLDSRLMKVSLRGGAPQTLATVPGAGTRGAVWTENDTVVYATAAALLRVPEGGGSPETLMTRPALASEKGELFFGSPRTLPGVRALLLGVDGYDPEHSTISVFSDGRREVLHTDGTLVAYLATGHILYVRPTQGQMYDDWHDAFVVPFDLKTLKTTGKPVPVLERVRYGQVVVSDNGTLAYASGSTGGVRMQLAWMPRDGMPSPVDARLTQRGNYLSPRVSPDGERLLYAFGTTQAASQLFVRDLATGTMRIVAGAPSWWSTWTPDGRRIVYIHLNPEGTAGNLYWKAADGTGAEERLTTSTRHQQPLFVTPDGAFVVYQEESPDTGFDLWMLPLHGERTPRVLLRTKANEKVAILSRDGHWLAYVSDQTGRDEIWVRPFPGDEGGLQVTNDGGTDPLWARDGRTLFYMNLASTRLFAVPVSRDPNLSFGVPVTTDGSWSGAIPYGRNYDITPDGRRLIMVSGSETAGNEITVVLNWFEELKQKLAVRK
jgi:eukaryotic-like serine/threonine-protein kinase